jgi:hypothetical protein
VEKPASHDGERSTEDCVSQVHGNGTKDHRQQQQQQQQQQHIPFNNKSMTMAQRTIVNNNNIYSNDTEDHCVDDDGRAPLLHSAKGREQRTIVDSKKGHRLRTIFQELNL